MFAIIYSNLALLFFICFHVTYCERRIKDGSVVNAEKRYVVYFVKAGTISTQLYDTWVCGGALISKEFVLTSAACITDIDFLYVIAGYHIYVRDEDIEKNECTSKMKKKVVFTCIPYGYVLDYSNVEKWSQIDIALAKVESPYDFNDARYQVMCSYVPSTIPINYDPKYQGTKTDAVVFGWGHTKFWRKISDKSNHNQEFMRYAPVLILDKEICKGEYMKDYPTMVPVIDKYMICSFDVGNIDDDGEPIEKLPLKDKCGRNQHVRMGPRGEICEDDPKMTPARTVQGLSTFNEQGGRRNTRLNGTIDDIRNERASFNKTNFRRSVLESGVILRDADGFMEVSNKSQDTGICQNDHGGPLVTWVGSHEVLIGIASVFKVTEQYECVGPYLYTSTFCNGAFLDCVINYKFGSKGHRNGSDTRRQLCESPPSVRGFDTVEKYISWKKHPAGPAANENHEKALNLRERFSSKKENSFDYYGLREKKEPLFNFELPANEGREKEGNDRFSSIKEHSFNFGLPDSNRFRAKKT